MSVHCSTRMHSSFKTALGKIRDKYQAYYTMYKTHAMTTHHGGTGCPLDGGINLNTEDQEPMDIDNESTQGSHATVALEGSEAEGHPNEPVYSYQGKLTAPTRKMNDLHQ